MLAIGIWTIAFIVSGVGVEGENPLGAVLRGLLLFAVAGLIAAWVLPPTWSVRMSVVGQLLACYVGGALLRSAWVLSGGFDVLKGYGAVHPFVWIVTGAGIESGWVSLLAQAGWTGLPLLVGAFEVVVFHRYRHASQAAGPVGHRSGI